MPAFYDDPAEGDAGTAKNWWFGKNSILGQIGNNVAHGPVNQTLGSKLFGGAPTQEQIQPTIDAYKAGAPQRSDYQNADLSAATSLALKDAQSTPEYMQKAYDLMYGQASGQGPSAALAAMNAGVSQAQNNAQAMAASQRGGGGLAARNAMMAGAAAQGQAAGQGAIARAQEQQQAMANLGSMAGTMGNYHLGALGGAVKGGGAELAGSMAYSGANQNYGQGLSNLLDTTTMQELGNTPAGMQSQQSGDKLLGGGLQAAGTIFSSFLK